jgi:hypothetical protein
MSFENREGQPSVSRPRPLILSSLANRWKSDWIVRVTDELFATDI